MGNQPGTESSLGGCVSVDDLVDVEPWQAVLDEAELTLWRAEIALSGHSAAATLLAHLLCSTPPLMSRW